MAEQFEEKKDNISEEEIKDTASTNEDNNGTVNQDEQTEEAVETVEIKIQQKLLIQLPIHLQMTKVRRRASLVKKRKTRRIRKTRKSMS